MTDIIDILKDNWNPANTDGITPLITYDVPQGNISSRNYNQGVFLLDIKDNLDELGLNRSHQDSGSADIFSCQAIERSKALTKKFIDEVRRICRDREILLTDADYSWLDWEGGDWGGLLNRWTFTTTIFAYRSGIPFST